MGVQAIKQQLDTVREAIAANIRKVDDLSVRHREKIDQDITKREAADREAAGLSGGSGGSGPGGPEVPNGSAPNHEYGTRFFGEEQLKYYEGDNPTLGREGSAVFMMPSEDAAGIRDGVDAAVQSGLAPSVTDAAREGRRIFGAQIPVGHLPQRLPTITDANGWPHFHPGGHTAVNIDGIVLPNATREFVVDGGSPLSAGTIVFELLDDGVIDIRGIVGS